MPCIKTLKFVRTSEIYKIQWSVGKDQNVVKFLWERRAKPLTVATEEVGIKVLSKMASRCVGSEYSLKY